MRRARGYALGVAIAAIATAGCPSTDQLVNGVRDPGSDGGADGAVEPGVCPDGKRNGVEGCDGTDFGESTCASVVAPGWIGALACTASCTIDDKNCATPPTKFSPLDGSDSLWKFQRISDFNQDAFGYRGAAFDGKHIYFVPYEAKSGALGLVAQYNLGGFTVVDSWRFFDLPTKKSPAAKGFEGGAFDGRYVYFVPGNESGAAHGTVARYDTRGGFTSADAWQVFDLTGVDPAAKGFTGAVFDGKFLTLVPGENGAAAHGLVLRFDVSLPFDQVTSWAAYDLVAHVNPLAKGFFGGAFDGTYVYFSPASGGVAVRFDTRATFKAKGSWAPFDLTQVAALKPYLGAVFDGRYVYLVPGGGSGEVVRFDTTKSFEAVTSWTPFDAEANVCATCGGFRGGVFDGRYVYLVPFLNGTRHGTLVRYDTASPFDLPGSWGFYDMALKNPLAIGYFGAGFDGRYIYLVQQNHVQPDTQGVAARFEVKDTPWLPRGWNASF